MRAALTSFVLVVLVACDIASPVVDREPKIPPTIYDGYIVACRMPKPCDSESTIVTTMEELRPLDSNPAFEPLAELAANADQDTGLRSIRLDEVSWQRSNVVIDVAEPTEIVLAQSTLKHVQIKLEGPVTLRFAEHTELTDVGLSSASESSRLAFDHARATDLTVGDAEHTFAGRLDARHTYFERPSINVATVELDSVAITRGFVAAESLRSRDGLMTDVAFDLGDGLFAPTQINMVVFTHCDALSFFSSRLEDVRIPRCTGEATRFYESTVVRARIDGEISADSSKLEAALFGVEQPTSLVLWASHVMLSTFCDMADDAAFETRGVQCSACSEAFEAQASLCTLPVEGFNRAASWSGRDNFCEALDAADACAPPTPDRPRPQLGE